MITGFEIETAPLTEYEEKELLPVFIEGLSNKKGKYNAVTSSDIIKGLKRRGLKVNGARVRKLINHIRTKDIIPLLCGSSKGYWIEDDQFEVERYIKSLTERIQAISQVKESIERQLFTMRYKSL